MSSAAPPFALTQWCAFLNRMLEAERAGARALLEFLGEYPRDGEAWKLLRKVQGDEAHNCVVLGELLKRAGEPYSHATGQFLDKALALLGRRAPVEFPWDGLGWPSGGIEAHLPRAADGAGARSPAPARKMPSGGPSGDIAPLKTKEL